jgi:glycerol-3-phosphate O-acyltransferase
MTPRFGRSARAFAERYFSGFALDPQDAKLIKELESRGSVVYVMRYASRLDYLLFNWLFLREGLRLATFANGIWYYYYRPLVEATRLLLTGLLRRVRRGFRSDKSRGLEFSRNVVRLGGSMFLFLRTDKLGLRSRRRALRSGRSEQDYLQTIVETAFEEPTPVFLVPLALFWHKGPHHGRRFLNIFYGARERPTDTGKVVSFLWNYRNLAVRVGEPIDLASFIGERREEGAEQVARKVRRSLLIFLRREEKPVEGASLRPVYRIEELVVRDPEVQSVVRELAGGHARSERRLQRRARSYLREIAANPSPTALAVLDVIVSRLFQRLFDRFEVHGLERVAQAAKLSPLVLVPSHRSHFDYLILSWLFYEQHLVPPLVAAGENLSFWPLGPIFRRGGGYFLRRSFAGDRLYATVFRRYVQQLIKDGATQEFFIEGSRSRSGKTLPPRLGMIGMVLEAYARGVRRDVFLVPVGFSYERLVEERSVVDERAGSKKTGENLLGLLRARSVLRERFGSATVRFGEPISLAELVGKDRDALRDPSEDRRDERRRAVYRAGWEVCRRLNGLVTAGRSNVLAAVLLAARGRGVRRDKLVDRARRLLDMLHAFGVEASEALRDDLEANLEGTVASLEAAGHVKRLHDPAGEIVWYEESATNVLDYYRAGLAPLLVIPGVLSLADDDEATASQWLDWLRLEYLPPDGAERDVAFATARRVLRSGGDPLFGRQVIPALVAYEATFGAVHACDGNGTRQEVEAAALSAVQSALLLGSARPNEAADRAMIANALEILVEERVLELEGKARDPAARLAPGPEWERLEAARALLAKGIPIQ